ncbi:unnamed protein product [Rhizophagus irregularis]|nr:unnamed protein product [Rhizophagus irregularis]
MIEIKLTTINNQSRPAIRYKIQYSLGVETKVQFKRLSHSADSEYWKEICNNEKSETAESQRTIHFILYSWQCYNGEQNSLKHYNSVQAGSITSGKLLKATEILSDIHMSVNNIGRLRYLVGKMRIFIHLAKEYLGVIHCVQTKHDLKINS